MSVKLWFVPDGFIATSQFHRQYRQHRQPIEVMCLADDADDKLSGCDLDKSLPRFSTPLKAERNSPPAKRWLNPAQRGAEFVFLPRKAVGIIRERWEQVPQCLLEIGCSALPVCLGDHEAHDSQSNRVAFDSGLVAGLSVCSVNANYRSGDRRFDL